MWNMWRGERGGGKKCWFSNLSPSWWRHHSYEILLYLRWHHFASIFRVFHQQFFLTQSFHRSIAKVNDQITGNLCSSGSIAHTIIMLASSSNKSTCNAFTMPLFIAYYLIYSANMFFSRFHLIFKNIAPSKTLVMTSS